MEVEEYILTLKKNLYNSISKFIIKYDNDYAKNKNDWRRVSLVK